MINSTATGSMMDSVALYKNRNLGEKGEVLSLALILIRKELLFINSDSKTPRFVKSVKFQNNIFVLSNATVTIIKNNREYLISLSLLEEQYEIAKKSIKKNLMTNLINLLMLDSDKSSCAEKQDIQILFEDQDSWEGYSIKTFIGASPSLLNASQKTIFYYECENKSEINYDEIKKIKLVKDKINKIKETSPDIESKGSFSEIFKNNINLIEENFDKKLGNILLNSYYSVSKKFKDNFFNIDDQNSVKELLWMSCLGMNPSKTYELDNGNTCGLILYDGQSVFIFKDNKEFKQFLFDHAKFDTPSTKRHVVVDKHPLVKNNQFGITLQIRLDYPKEVFKIQK